MTFCSVRLLVMSHIVDLVVCEESGVDDPRSGWDDFVYPTAVSCGFASVASPVKYISIGRKKSRWRFIYLSA